MLSNKLQAPDTERLLNCCSFFTIPNHELIPRRQATRPSLRAPPFALRQDGPSDDDVTRLKGSSSLVKRGIGGVYHQVSQKYLQTYLDEYSFRYNRIDRGNFDFHFGIEAGF